MDRKKFRLWNYVTAIAVFIISALTYLLTIEPTASFWDCGEFIASSYKLEVGHPPGNPMFQIIARIFTIFGDGQHAAMLVNSMSAICSALTIFFLYLTIVFFAKRLVEYRGGGLGKGSAAGQGIQTFRDGSIGPETEKERGFSLAGSVAIMGSGAVGALAYCFSDTFWFSAVEGEVYAMSSLATAVVFWAMTKWYEQAESPYANRWIVLISFIMGLSIGIHMLNLLAIPVIIYMYYYRKNENGRYGFRSLVKIMALSIVILGLLVFAVVPYLPKIAAYCDLLFVNVFGLPYNSGAAFFLVGLLALCFWGLFETMKRSKVFWNTVLLCATTVIIGFSSFSMDVIRSSAKTPTNEYQPDNCFTLVRYLSREQYGKTPLIYGQYFDSPYELKTTKYWAPIDGRYKKVEGPVDAKYRAEGKMLFPRMHSSDARHTAFYEMYTGGKGKLVPGAEKKKPTMGANLLYFFDYQMNWMYWRYFMWNFAGRQNEIHSPTPGEIFYGNWESGIKAVDSFRLGDQSDAPAILKENKGKNHYFFLPLILGLLGLFFQFARDKRGSWLVFLLFFMTGIAIVLYLNQPPYQVRERDYAYAGSFYAFCIWIGLAVAAVYGKLSEMLKGRAAVLAAGVTTVAFLFVPALMCAENWDDHDRSNRRTAVEMAKNYLNSTGKNGILITHGDNDTFPLWFAQEVEEFRNDVRICNTSLLGTDWHIDQMRYAVNESSPLPLSVDKKQYLYGTNEYVYIYDTREQVTDIADVMAVFKDSRAKLTLQSGRKVDYLCARKIRIPVNRENALSSGIVPQSLADRILDSIVIEIPADKDYLTKPELFMLDLLSGYQWDRPVHMLNQGGDLNIGMKDYLMYDGFSSHLVPFRNSFSSTDPGLVDTDTLYGKMTEDFCFDALSRTDYFVDYQNMYTFLGTLSQRGIFMNAATAFLKAGEKDRALEMLDMCQEKVRKEMFPYETIPVGFSGNDYMVIRMIRMYYALGQGDKARDVAVDLFNSLLESSRFFIEFYADAKSEYEQCATYIYLLEDAVKEGGDGELAEKIHANFESLIEYYSKG